MARDAQQPLISVAEAAALLGVSRSTVWRWVRSGRLPSYRVGAVLVRVRRDDVARLVVPEQRGGNAGEHDGDPLAAVAKADALVATIAELRRAVEGLGDRARRRRGG